MGKTTRALTVAVAAMALACHLVAQDESTGGDDPLNAIVKLEISTSTPDFGHPWRRNTGGVSGTGVVIEQGRILTCAHCVSDSTFIRVRKNNDDAIYHATPLFIDNDRDLALVTVDDKSFMTGILPMEIGETPPVQSEVVAVGYPLGGRLISFTRGIVSRIEEMRYEQGWTYLLAAQVDAAINPGNSGGPVLDMGTGLIAGIAFQGKDGGESLGYMIHTDIIRCFLDDIRDGRIDGAPQPIFHFESLEGEAARRYLGMVEGQTGTHLSRILPSAAAGLLKVGDVLLEVDGIRVANNGDIRLPGNQIRTSLHPFYMRQMGQKVPVKILRGGAVVNLALPAARPDMRCRRFLHDEKPDYYLCGGVVFTTCSFSYMVSQKPAIADDVLDSAEKAGQDKYVMISDVLADMSTEGYVGSGGLHVRTMNGVKVRNLAHLVELMEGSKDEFFRFGIDSGEENDDLMVFDAAALRGATKRVMERYAIPSDRSDDLK